MKLFEDKAPGLFDHLSRLSGDDQSTDVGSEVSSNPTLEESRQSIFIPTPTRIFKPSDCQDLSNPIRIPRLESKSTHVQEIKAPARRQPNQNKIFEEVQRQRILKLMSENTLILNSIISSSDASTKKITNAIAELKSFKTECNESNMSQLEKIEHLKEQKKCSKEFDPNPTSVGLFNHLFGVGQVFKYGLVLDCSIPEPIFRERNLVLKLKLVNLVTGEKIQNTNKVVLHLSMHTWEVPSSPILRNKSGNKAIMGDTEIEMTNGEANFDRLQINEVTSKFIHGYVAMTIVPSKPCNYGTSLVDHQGGNGYVHYEDIKPLMLEKVVVKSKKKNNQKKTME